MLRGDELTSQQDLMVLLASAELALTRGEVERARQFMADADELAKTLLPPAQRIIGLQGQRAALLLYVGRFNEAIEALDRVAEQLQPPMSSNLNFTYSSIYAAAENREEFRRWAQTSFEMRDQLPEPYGPIIALEQAQLNIWDGNMDAALEAIDGARAMLDRSIITFLQDSLTASELFVNIALLYLEAGDTDKAKRELEDVLLVYPGNAYAKMVLARVLIAEGDEENARLFLENALELWSGADDNFLYREQAREVLASLSDT